jgi:hypothetical protein
LIIKSLLLDRRDLERNLATHFGRDKRAVLRTVLNAGDQPNRFRGCDTSCNVSIPDSKGGKFTACDAYCHLQGVADFDLLNHIGLRRSKVSLKVEPVTGGLCRSSRYVVPEKLAI